MEKVNVAHQKHTMQQIQQDRQDAISHRERQQVMAEIETLEERARTEIGDLQEELDEVQSDLDPTVSGVL